MATTGLITGAGGLLGSWVTQHWPRDAPRLDAVRRSEVDLLEPGAATRLVESVRPAFVVHLAWSASGSPDYRTSDDNARWVDATLELVAACAGVGASLWAAGTVVDDDPRPSDAYARSKRDLRLALGDAIDAATVGWLRPTYVFDEVRRRPGLVAGALAARERGEDMELAHPDSAHDFVHASDVGTAIVRAVLAQRRGSLTIGSGRLRRVSEMCDALGSTWRAGDAPSAGAQTHSGSPAEIGWLRDLGWSPTKTEEFFPRE